MKTLNEFLINNNATACLYEFAKDLTLKDFCETCQRGDWMLWLFENLQPTKRNKLRLAGAHSANTVRSLMKDKRSIKVIDWIINNNGKKPPLKLMKDAEEAANTADAYADTAATGYSSIYADAAHAAAAIYYMDIYCVAVAAADAADAYGFPTTVGYTAREENQRQTADICRQYLPLKLWGEIK